MEYEDHIPAEAKKFYDGSRWWPETVQAVGDFHSLTSNRDGVNGIYMPVGKDNFDYTEIITPEISQSLEFSQDLPSTRKGVYDICGAPGNGNGGLDHVFGQNFSSEIVEVVEDGKSTTSVQGRRDDDIYVAVGKDDLDVVKWALDHAVSPGARIFLIHVSPPITLIPTPVGKLLRSQLTQEQVKSYMNEENNRRKNLLQKYIQLSTEAKVTSDALLLESNDTGKAILDLISILNITNLVIGIKKPLHYRRKNKLSEGEFVKKNAPEFCAVTLVYNGNKVVSNLYMDALQASGLASPPHRGHSKSNLFHCTCFSGCMSKVKD